jgi:putative molybdopterin biosynthesis protein
MNTKNVYLHDIPLPAAWESLNKALVENKLDGVLGVEDLSLDEALVGRVTAEAVWARLSSPHYHAAAMDGFALRAADTDNAMPSAPITLNYGLQAVYVDTGDALPEWANAVVPIENVEALDENETLTDDVRKPFRIRLRAALTPWSHVRSMGEDIVATQLVLPAGHVLRPVDLGAVAAAGLRSLKVTRCPRVAIIPTGSELVEIGSPVKAGDIIEYNALVLAAQVKQWGGSPCALRLYLTSWMQSDRWSCRQLPSATWCC